MQCLHVRRRLNAWVDDEMPAGEASKIAGHLKQCLQCRREADGIRQISGILDALPVWGAPPALGRKTLRAFRENLEKAGMAEWWRGLSLAMRSAFYGAVLAGLLFGAILGTSMLMLGTDGQANPYQTLYAGTSKGLLP